MTPSIVYVFGTVVSAGITSWIERDARGLQLEDELDFAVLPFGATFNSIGV
jgi:hypothetical protein